MLQNASQNVTLHVKRGLMDFTKNREFFFTVTVREFEFPHCEFQIPRLIHSMWEFFTLGVKLIKSRREFF